MSQHRSAIEHLFTMQMLERKQGSSHVEPATGLVAPQITVVVGGIELPTERHLQEKMQMLRRVVSLVEFDDKGGIAHPRSRCIPSLFPDGFGVQVASQVSAARSSRS